MKKGFGLLAAALIFFTSCHVQAEAQGIRFSQGALSVPVTTSAGEHIQAITDSLQLLGVYENGSILLYLNGQFGTADKAALSAILGDGALAGLPSVSSFRSFKGYAQGSDVSAMQSALVSLGYLQGTADGEFGGKTMAAVSAFQAAMGLESSGNVDVPLQLLILSMAQEETVVSASASFASIRSLTSADLTPLEESGMLLEYDDISGTGWISASEAIEFDQSGEWDIDRYLFSLRFGFNVLENAEGELDIIPTLLVDCTCVRRPIMEKILMKSGDKRWSADISGLQSSLVGVMSREQAAIILPQEAQELLAATEEAGELKIRIEGKYCTFDFVIPQTDLASVARVGRLAPAL